MELSQIKLQSTLSKLKELLLKKMPLAGDYSTSVGGFALHRFNSGSDPKPNFYDPVIIIVVQGKKQVHIGSEIIAYGDSSCFIAGVNMPVSSCVVQASEEKPYLSMSLSLDKAVIASLASKVPPAYERGNFCTGAVVQELDAELANAFMRLLELTERPDQEAQILGSLISQEIHYRLLASPFGYQLRLLNTLGSQSNQIIQAITWLREHYTEPMDVDELAMRMNMAPSTFHKHFKDITTLSPLQYQKRLRLIEAQRLMLTHNFDATQAGLSVGYESATQFNREYKRLFGETPRRDVNRLKAGAGVLQLDSMKSESLVTVGQHTTVNAFPGLVHTARHTTKVGFTRSR